MTAQQISNATGTGSQMMTETDAGRYLSVSIHALRQWRYRGGGPKFVKLGSSVRYRLIDLEAFVQSNIRDNTSQG